MTDEPSTPHRRRARYAGKYPRRFDEKYKEHRPEQYPETVRKVLAPGKTPAGAHVPILSAEILEALDPRPGDTVVDCTLGYGGHARAMLPRIQPGGKLLGLDVDPLELPKTEARMRRLGFGPDVFAARRSNFAGLPAALAAEALAGADCLLAYLGVSSMQFDNPARGFSYKGVGPLDMRMNPSRGAPASVLIARTSASDLAALLVGNADEPHAELIARLLKQGPLESTQLAERRIRLGLVDAMPSMSKADVTLSVRRTFQALRIAVNDEFSALDALLRHTIPILRSEP